MSVQSFSPLQPYLGAVLEGIRSQIQPYTDAAQSCERELTDLLTREDIPVHYINDRISAISKTLGPLNRNARLQLGFVPEKLNNFSQSFCRFFEQWEWMMRDDHFQDPFHQFYAQVQRLSCRSNLTSADYSQLKCCFSSLSEEDRLKVLSYIDTGSSSFATYCSCSSSHGFLSVEEFNAMWADQEGGRGMPSERLRNLLDRLQSDCLRAKVSSLGAEELEFLKKSVEMRARAEGVIIEDWDLDWRHHHLFDSPSRLVSALSQVSLRRRNEKLFALWNDLKQRGTGKLAVRLLMQCPLLDDVRSGKAQAAKPATIAELNARAAYLNRFLILQMRLEVKYPCLKWIFQDPSHPLSKGMHEKLMQIIMSPAPLFGDFPEPKLLSSLNAYLEIVNELTHAGQITEADAKYLLDVANSQYALHPTQPVAKNEEALMQLLTHAKSALRSCQLNPESGMVRQKEEQYQSIYLLKKDGETVGKFKPLPLDSLKKEMLGEAFNALLGTDFAPAATGVWLSIRKELLSIRSLLASGRREEAMNQFNLLDERLRHEIYYQIFELKSPIDPPESYGELAWHGHPDLPVTNEERMEAIDRYLNPKRPLEIILGCFESGDFAQAMERFQLLNFDLKHFVYYQLFLIKNPVNPPGEYGEWAWNGHPEYPVTDEERREAINRCLASDSFDQFLLSRDPTRFHFQGTLQTWAQGCVEGTDLIYNNPLAGQMLRNMPVSWVQLYNILGIIKGSGDCHSGNTLFQCNASNQIANLIDCDDEFIMPNENHIDQIQIWTLGFPQASKPLLKPIVRMLASPEFVDKWIKFIRSQSRDIMDPKIQAFEFRIQRLSHRCREELEKSSISLTCQDLYFEVYGGREKFEQLKLNEGNRPEFILFQYFMKDGMVQYLNEEKMSGEIFRRNVQDLYL
ncbi:MAG: hypothetical protein JSR39_00595 [Verrucomicrobia bacterium]|nr:hypothetical protein [Verrucomicrobiota bacterium]